VSLGYDDPLCLATSRPSDCALVLADRMSSSVEGAGVDGRKGFVVAESVASVVGSSGLIPSPKIITVAVDAIAQWENAGIAWSERRSNP
jgi:hypothetical protein